MSDSDAALIARVVTDDDRIAFELLVRRYQSPLRNFLRRMTRNDAERADDLAQETLLKLYTSIASFKAQAKFSTWLYRIAYNTFLNDVRKIVPEAEFDEAYHSPMTDNSAAAGDQRDVDAALERLPDRQRAVFDLHYKKGMTHQEVANALELPLGTVKSDLTRGREALKAMLEDWEQA
ncbi:MAG TPA: sigma-70 family RNA polymerase sigma factor [Gammaproteobacteria bacterium]|nr:sigma-70 family RNA polymerase sigma factor [Gammaproteobacteria bacterium]